MRISSAALGMVCVIATACHGAETPTSGTPTITILPNGAPEIISLSPTRWQDTNGWKLRLDHVVEPPDDAPGALGNPNAVALTETGDLYVVETQPARIDHFDSTGRFVGTIGREGAGPGEFRFPTVAIGAHEVLVQDPQLTRLTIFTLDGELIRAFASTCCNFGPPAHLDARGRLTTAAFSMTNGTARSTWIVFDTLGHRLDSLDFPVAVAPAEWTVTTGGGNGVVMATSSFRIPLAPRTRQLQLTNGDIAFGRNDQYRVVVINDRGDTVRVFGRDRVAPVPIPAAVRDSLFKPFGSNPKLAGVAHESDLPTRYPLWDAIHADGAGNIWIASGTPTRPPQFDVFAPDGPWLGAVASSWKTGSETAWAGNRVAVLDTDAEGLPRVRVFRIDHGAYP